MTVLTKFGLTSGPTGELTKSAATRRRRLLAFAAALAALLLFAAACSSSDDEMADDANAADTADGTAAANTEIAGTTITLLTHDSFSLSPDTLSTFTDETGVTVEHLALGDTGVLVSQSILNKDNPLGDVLYGIDNTFLSRAINEDVFLPYQSPALANIGTELAIDSDDQYRVTPIDYGDVCINYWRARYLHDELPPASLDDLISPTYADQLVVQHPESSSPGLAFLLATIAQYGEDGWEDYWTALRANGVQVTSDWNSAYYGEFIAGGGDLPLVVSYASSPPAEVMFSEPPVDFALTGVVTDSCFRQVEYAGILRGTENEPAAQALIDFMLSQRFQEDLPTNMFVFPVIDDAVLPQVFLDYAVVPENPLRLAPEVIEANRDAWTQRWVEIVLR